MLAIYFLWKDNTEQRWNQNLRLEDISGCKFRLKSWRCWKFLFVCWVTPSWLSNVQPALKACKLIFFCENNKNVLRGILTDLWLIPGLTQRMIGWLENHNSKAELLSNYFRLSATSSTFPRYNQQIISNVLQGKKHVRALNHSLNTQLTRTFCGKIWKKFKIFLRAGLKLNTRFHLSISTIDTTCYRMDI